VYFILCYRVITPPDLGLKTNFSFPRTIYHPEYAIFQGGVIKQHVSSIEYQRLMKKPVLFNLDQKVSIF